MESHPVALAQCSGFLRQHPHLEAQAAYDTAGAAAAVADAGDRTRAAIASDRHRYARPLERVRAAAETYRLLGTYPLQP